MQRLDLTASANERSRCDDIGHRLTPVYRVQYLLYIAVPTLATFVQLDQGEVGLDAYQRALGLRNIRSVGLPKHE